MTQSKKKSSILIGIAGGTGSGKTLVAEMVIKDLTGHSVTIIQQDSYYKNLSHLSFEERSRHNFDHPDAVDIPLLVSQIQDLLRGRTIDQPIYDFSKHLRSEKTKRIDPQSIVILEGILIFYYPELRKMMDIKIFVDTDPDIRFIRRLRRDLESRGRTMESVIDQYIATVRPMHLEFVEPSKRYADIIIPEGGYNEVAVDLLKTKIQSLLNRNRTFEKDNP
jgi:uridine kinase